MAVQQLNFPFVTFTYSPPQQLQEFIAKLYDTKWVTIASKKRNPELVEARFLYSYFAYRDLYKTLEDIGGDLKRHYSTIIYALEQVDDHLSSKDPSYDDFRHKFAQTQQFFITNQLVQNEFSNIKYSPRASFVRFSKAPAVQKSGLSNRSGTNGNSKVSIPLSYDTNRNDHSR